MSEMNFSNRIEIIDALRGFSVFLMVIHHFLFNIHVFLGAPRWVFFNPAFTVLAPFFAGVFIFLAGVSSRFAASNIKRGLKVLALAAGITVVTYFIGMPIWFGVLHLLGFSMVFFGLTYKFWDFIPRHVAHFLFVILIVGGAFWANASAIPNYVAWVLGFGPPGRAFLFSYDFFPLVPWLFVFLLGTWVGIYIKELKLPEWFYDFPFPAFPKTGLKAILVFIFYLFSKIGRKSLLIYVVHQPVLYGAVMGVVFLRG